MWPRQWYRTEGVGQRMWWPYAPTGTTRIDDDDDDNDDDDDDGKMMMMIIIIF